MALRKHLFPGSLTSYKRANSCSEASAQHQAPGGACHRPRLLSSSHYLIVSPSAHPLPPFSSNFPCLVLILLDPEAQGQEP